MTAIKKQGLSRVTGRSGRFRPILTTLLCIVAVAVGCGWHWLRQRDTAGLLRSAIRAAKRGDPEQAVPLFDRILAVHPEHALALVYRAQLARDAGDSRLALSLLRRVPESSVSEAGTARFIEGTMLLEANRARDAERLLLRSIELVPTSNQARERLAQLYFVQFRSRELRSVLDAVREFRALSLEELIVLCDLTEPAHSAAENIPRLTTWIAADPDDIESSAALARYHLYAERPAEAAATLEEARKRHPRDVRLGALLAEIMVAQSRLPEAFDLLGQFPPAGDSPAELWKSHGVCLHAVEDWSGAAACLERAWLAEPEDLPVAYQLGQAWERSGETQAAEQLLQRTRIMERVALSVFRVRMGDMRRTDLLLPVAVDIAEALIELGRFGQAIAWVERMQEWFPDNPQVVTLSQKAQRRQSADLSEAAAVRQLVSLAAAARGQERDALPDGVAGQRRTNGSDSKVRTASRESAMIRMVDCASEARLNFQYLNGASGQKYLLETLGGGVAVLDYDGDGWPDLYFTQGRPLTGDPPGDCSSKLFRNLGEGTFLELTEPAGLVSDQYGQGVAAGDYDNDGFADLVVGNFGTNILQHNNGDGTFTDVTPVAWSSARHWTSSVALADLDGDGNVDLYVVNYVLEPFKVCRTSTGTLSTCSPANFTAEDDFLYQNRGDGTFADVSESAGIRVPSGKGLGILVADFDNDRRPDIYVANDGTPNFLFRNAGPDETGRPRFVEMGLAAGCAVNAAGSAQAGMGIACADLNADGLLDLYVTNFYREYNTLYVNDGEMLFRDTTRAARLVEPTLPMLGFGTQAIDLDLDGQADLIVTNGHIDDFRFRDEPWKMPPQVFRNAGNLQFDDVTAECGEFFHGKYLGRGLARLDWNRDGKPDAVIVHQDRPVALLRNQTIAAGRSLVIDLRGVRSNRDAIGARLVYVVNGVTRHVEITGGDGFFATNEHRQVLGLGAADHVERLELFWPSGATQVIKELPADSHWMIVEGREPQRVP